MPNWCMTKIYIQHSSLEELKKLKSQIENLQQNSCISNEFGKNWLGHILVNAQIGQPQNYYYRGTIDYLEIIENALLIETSTAWEPCIKMWKDLIEFLLPEAKILYSAEEPGEELFWTNDKELADTYYVDSCAPEIGFSDKCSANELISILQDYFNTTEDNIDTLIDMAEAMDEYETYIYRWKYVHINDLS